MLVFVLACFVLLSVYGFVRFGGQALDLSNRNWLASITASYLCLLATVFSTVYFFVNLGILLNN